jgi:hypothetical protein
MAKLDDQFWRVGPRLADRGRPVVSVDLPVHGGSVTAQTADLVLFASSVVETAPHPGNWTQVAVLLHDPD